jgi:isoaspartyl peptidase/L-asparaginase-like protein (Ntn-hydrolase superfamily)
MNMRSGRDGEGPWGCAGRFARQVRVAADCSGTPGQEIGKSLARKIEFRERNQS